MNMYLEHIFMVILNLNNLSRFLFPVQYKRSCYGIVIIKTRELSKPGKALKIIKDIKAEFPPIITAMMIT